MQVSLRFFASLREAVGRREMGFELDDGATVEQLKLRLGQVFPAIEPLMSKVVCAVDDEYVAPGEKLRAGSEVALIPPVSGGAQVPLFRVTHDAIESEAPALAEAVRRAEDGAVALFYGVVRNNSEGQNVERLEY